MGNIVANVSRFSLRKTRRFNVENRTHRFLDKSVKVVPPKHDSTLKEIEELHRANPNLLKELSQKDDNHHGRLKDVYVSSYDPHVEFVSKGSRIRPLPVERNVGPQPAYGYVEPETLTPGRISLKTANELLTLYQSKKNDVNSLAQNFNLKLKDVENLVSYYRVFKLLEVPEHKKELPGPTDMNNLYNTIALIAGKHPKYKYKVGSKGVSIVEKEKENK